MIVVTTADMLGSKSAFAITTEAKHTVRPAKPGFTAQGRCWTMPYKKQGTNRTRWKKTDFERQNMNSEEVG